MYHLSLFFAWVATFTTLINVSFAAPQAPGFPAFWRPSVPPSNPWKPAVSTVCFTSKKAPALKGRPTTKYTTIATCTTTSTLVVTTTVSPSPAVTTSTVTTTSTTTGLTSTNVATTTIVTTTTQFTTLSVSTTTSVTTATQTVTVRDSPFKYAVDTFPNATFSKRKRSTTPPGSSPNFKFTLGNFTSFPTFGGDVSCISYQSQCAVIVQTTTSTTKLAPATITSTTTNTVVVTSIPIANVTVTVNSTATTTSTITPDPTTVTSTVSVSGTTTVHVDKCSPSNIVGGINAMGIVAVDAGASDASSTNAATASDCCLAVTGNPNGALFVWYSGTCYAFTYSSCSGIEQSDVNAQVFIDSNYAAGSGFYVGNANCGSFNAWSQ